MTPTTTVNKELEIFRNHYSGTKCNVEDGFITYKVAASYGKRAAKRANDLIKLLGLHLIAESNGSPYDNSFIVKSR